MMRSIEYGDLWELCDRLRTAFHAIGNKVEFELDWAVEGGIKWRGQDKTMRLNCEGDRYSSVCGKPLTDENRHTVVYPAQPRKKMWTMLKAWNGAEPWATAELMIFARELGAIGLKASRIPKPT